MNTLKFKAYKKTGTPEMLKVVNINFDEQFIRGLAEVETNLDIESSYKFDEIELLQSTGLKDKNGKEIYEGDILKVFVLGDVGAIAKVIFKNGMFGIEDDMHGYGYDKGLYSLHQILSFRDTEILGNIYQDEHLLEEE